MDFRKPIPQLPQKQQQNQMYLNLMPKWPNYQQKNKCKKFRKCKNRTKCKHQKSWQKNPLIPLSKSKRSRNRQKRRFPNKSLMKRKKLPKSKSHKNQQPHMKKMLSDKVISNNKISYQQSIDKQLISTYHFYLANTLGIYSQPSIVSPSKKCLFASLIKS